ncbi:MAG TPA: ABC transporter permease [Burkholderiales bacterium]|nr:ABC transporter permease [Burkholderiales bacterium]
MSGASAAVQFLNGLANASTLFLVAAGLSLIFGVTRIVNFAHGSLYMLGMYLAVALAPITGFWGALPLAALAVALTGALAERLLLRRLYEAPELMQLVATFALVLVIRDAALWAWGPVDLLGPRAPGLSGAVDFLGARFPQYDLFLIGLGPLVLAALWWVLRRTRWGVRVRAATQDRDMVRALGVNAGRLYTGVFVLGALLAGFGGALQIPREPATLSMDLQTISDAFVVVVVGGLGSIPGAFLAALLIGEVKAFCIGLGYSEFTLALEFVVMAVVLVLRPWGLLGQAPDAVRGAAAVPPRLVAPAPPARAALAALAVALVLVPLFAGDYALVLLGDILLFALFAASLHLLVGSGGLLSFGHAAYFGLGAYGAGLALVKAGWPMLAALAAGPLLAALAAVCFGWFCVRLSGVYLAMLTLAFAQITWSVVYQWNAVTGGSNGLIGIWPSAPWTGRIAYYELCLFLTLVAIVLLWRVQFSPFGYALRAGRDSPVRAAATGIEVRAHQWAAFAGAGLLAGLAGALYAFSKGSISPESLAVPRSVDGLVMLLLGGLHTLTGPAWGAALFTWLEDTVSRGFDYWRAVLGGIMLVLVLAFPNGVSTLARRRP